MGIAFGYGQNKTFPDAKDANGKVLTGPDKRTLRPLITFKILQQEGVGDTMDKTDKCYTLQLHGIVPTEVTDSVQPNFDNSEVVGRSSPVAWYSNNGARTVSFSFDLHRDYDNRGTPEGKVSEHFEHTVQTLKSMNYPTYSKSGVIPPRIYCAIGTVEFPFKNLSIAGYATIGVTYKAPMDKWGRYMIASISVTMTEAPQVSFDSQEIRLGAYVQGRSPNHRMPDYQYPRKENKSTSSKKSTSSSSSKKTVNAKYTVIVSSLNVRKGPGTEYATTGKVLKKGTTVTVIATQKAKDGGTWGQIKSPYAGWINIGSKYCKKASSSKTTSAKPSSFKVKVTASSLNIRQKAGVKYKIVGSLKKGKTVTVVATKKVGSSTWGQIKSPKSGWINLSYTVGSALVEVK